jgi:PhoPQ-activated pathogenicity-related protein
LKDTDAQESIIAFYQTVLADAPRPKYSWTFESDGSIRVKTLDKPQAVTLWQATNPTTRDFRTAFFVELTFDVKQTFPLKLTTAVRVLPDKLPFADLDPTKAQLEVRAKGK